MTVPVMVGFRKTYPHIPISFLTRKQFVPVVDQLDGVEVIGVDLDGEFSGLTGVWKLAGVLKKNRFSAIADLHNVLRTKVLKVMYTGSGVPFAQIDKGRKEKKRLTAAKNKVFKPLPHTTTRYARVLEELGYPVPESAMGVLPKPAWPEQLNREVSVDEGTLVGLAPFAAHPGKQYSLDLMEETLELLAGRGDLRICLFGSPKEGEYLENWAQKYPNTVNLAGRLKFRDELAMIAHMAVMVGMDSANGHLAAMYGVPVITLWGVTHPYAGFAPYGQPQENRVLANREEYPAIPTSIYGNKVPPGYENAINSIKPREVVDKVSELLR